MRRIFKTRGAETDLENIWLYSFKQWNEEQADRYYDDLIDGIDRLLQSPEIGRARDNIRTGYRSIQINRHVVYYRLESRVIRIIRVLHERMMPDQHL